MSIVVKIAARNDLKETIAEAVELLGGMTSFVKPGEVVLVKPNFNTADPFPASSDVAFIRAVVELVYEAGAKLVIVGDSSTMTLNTRKVFEQTGVFALEEMPSPPRIMAFEDRSWVKKEIPGGRFLKCARVTELLDRVDRIVLLPCCKTHFLAQFTGALKLAVGLLKPLQRIALHAKNLQEKIAELNLLYKPGLVIMDARKCFITGGPAKGEMREPGVVLASTDRVAIDLEAIKLIQGYPGNALSGITPEKLPQVRRAMELGIGELPVKT